MIAVCEPLCRDVSHEKVNSGFIFGLSLAFPEEKIILFADSTHITAIKNILEYDRKTIVNLEYIPIDLKNQTTFLGLFNYSKLLRKLFSYVLANNTDKVFFLSSDPMLLYAIKRLKQKSNFIRLKFTIVLHADFENISNEGLHKNKPVISKQTKTEKLRQTRLSKLPRLFYSFMLSRFRSFSSDINKRVMDRLFSTRKMLLWRQSIDFRYITLSPHIVVNAEKFIDLKKLNIQTIYLPTIFAKPFDLPENSYPKFATFGYGNPAMMQKVLIGLEKKKIIGPYEIRIIGMDASGTDGFSNVVCPSPGKRLDRSAMEKYASDIDIFLILYENNQYRLSCTNSILEALSYMKPVLHLKNDCINTFNLNANPIGICCHSVDDLVTKMEDIILNYQESQQLFKAFRKNILTLRDKVSIENSVQNIRSSFTWQS